MAGKVRMTSKFIIMPDPERLGKTMRIGEVKKNDRNDWESDDVIERAHSSVGALTFRDLWTKYICLKTASPTPAFHKLCRSI